MHRPERKVLPTERVEQTAQTGPRPAFLHTYLEQLAALWPEEPDPPVTRIDWEDQSGEAPERRSGKERPATEPAEERVLTLPSDAPEPTVDIRR